MSAKTISECEAFVGSVQIGDRVTITWQLPGTHQRIIWAGVVKGRTQDAKKMQLLYDGQGPEGYEFPPASSEGEILDFKKDTGRDKPSMKRTQELTLSSALNLLDISTWSPFMHDRTTVSILLDKFERRYNCEPSKIHKGSSRSDKDEARVTHYYEKRTLISLLEAWLMEHVGPGEGFDKPPKNGVPQTILYRLDAFETTEQDGSSIYEYMRSVERIKDPKCYDSHRKAAKKKDGGEGPDL